MRHAACARTCVGVLLLLAAGTGTAAAEWWVVEVPMQPGWSGGVEVSDINDDGVACGMGNYVINTSSTAFRFDGPTGTVSELPHLEPNDPISLATGINSAGVVCGYSHNAAGASRAVYWIGATLHTIPYPPGANENADLRAYDINDAGIIVGYFWSTEGERTAFYYQDGVSYSLDAPLRGAGLFGLQAANGVSHANVICGVADDALGLTTAWTFDVSLQSVDVLGRIGTDDCSAVAINSAGQTIGRAQLSPLDPTYRAVTWDGSAWHVVDPSITAAQWGQAINDRGRMVGNTGSSAARWSWYSDAPGSGSMQAVNLPDWSRLSLQGINNHDWMAGYGRTPTSGSDDRGCIVRPPPGDADHDGFVTASDALALFECLDGPDAGTPPSEACRRAFDFAPEDGDVDLHDVAAFQSVFEGP